MTPPPAGKLPRPVDIRLVPALLLTMATCLAVPVLPYGVALKIPWALLVAAVVVTVLVIVVGRTHRPLRTTVIALTACALWIAAGAAEQAAGDRLPAKASGWDDVVSAGQPVRLSGEAAGRAKRSVGPFGESWHLTATVSGFGHPVRPAPPGTEVVVSESGDWRETGPGRDLCFAADLEAAGTSVFARARTGPDTGSCPAAGAEPGEATGREVVREAVWNAAVDSVGDAPQLLPGLALGDRSLQDPELDEAMKASGLSHLSAVSEDNFVKGYSRHDSLSRGCRGLQHTSSHGSDPLSTAAQRSFLGPSWTRRFRRMWV